MEIPFYTTFGHLFSFQFQPWALLSFAAVLFNIALVALVWKRATHDAASKTFMLFILCIVVWGISESLTRSSKTAEAAIFWGHFAIIGIVFLSVLFFVFVILITERGKLLEGIIPILLIFGPAMVFLFLFFNTRLIFSFEAEKVSWGWFLGFGPLFPVFLLWLEAFFMLSIFLLVRFYRTIEDKERKEQIKLILIGAVIPLMVGSVTDALLPLFGFHPPGISILATSFFAVFVAYAIVRYRLFIVSPVIALSTIIDTMSEALIVVNYANRIESVNKTALAMLGYQGKDIIGESFMSIIAGEKLRKDFEKHCMEPLRKRQKNTVMREGRFLTKKGKKISVQCSLSALRGPGGEVMGTVILASDITQRNKLISDLEAATKELQIVHYNLESQLTRIRE